MLEQKQNYVVDYSGADESHFIITKCTQCDDNYMQTTLNFLIFQANKMTFRDRYQAVIYYFMWARNYFPSSNGKYSTASAL